MNTLWSCHRSRLHTCVCALKQSPHSVKGKRASEQRWIARQLCDPYVKAARVHNYRCRSAFKLLEIDDKYKLLKAGVSVVDCGAAPGAWSQVVAQRVNSAALHPDLPTGFLVGVDLLRISPLDGAHFLSNSDITDPATQAEVQSRLPGGVADVILSDMAPNASGFREMDHEKLITMCLSVVNFAKKVLRPGGSLVCKYWDGNRAQQLQKRLEGSFGEVRTIKPKACRKESSELFFLARLFKS